MSRHRYLQKKSSLNQTQAKEDTFAPRPFDNQAEALFTSHQNASSFGETRPFDVQTPPLIQAKTDQKTGQRSTSVLNKDLSQISIYPTQPIQTQKNIIQRDVLPGKKIPKIEDLTKERFKELLKFEQNNIDSASNERGLADALKNLKDRFFMLDVFGKVVTVRTNAKLKPPLIDDLDEIETIIEASLDGATDLEDAKTKAENLVTDPVKRGRKNLVITFFRDSLNTSKNQATQTEKRGERDYLKPNQDVNANNLTNEFLTARQNVAIAGGKLTKQNRQAFANALKQMPTIQHLLEQKVVPIQNVMQSGWKDGGELADKIQYVVKTGISCVPENSIKKNEVKRNVQQADNFIRGIVEPQLLSTLPRPVIKVYTQKEQSLKNPLGFRAFQNGSEINVAFNESLSVIVHETGHYLEDHLPSEIWHDIQLLLRKRHSEAGGGRVGVGPAPILKEGRYKGDYKATGGYTSKVYDSNGSTEVMSMTLEFLSNPKNALKMIEKDPQQSAIILRGLRPTEYNSTNALRPFDQYLPN